jgi:hypothetical protein
MMPVKDFVGLNADISIRKAAARDVASGKSNDSVLFVTLFLLVFIKASTHHTGRNFPAITSIGALIAASIRAGTKHMTSSPWTARVIPPSRSLGSRAALQKGKCRNISVKGVSATTFGSSVSVACSAVISPCGLVQFLRLVHLIPGISISCISDVGGPFLNIFQSTDLGKA